MTRDQITPETVSAILARAPVQHEVGHQINQNHPVIGKCKLGAVFVDQAGDLCVYTGIGNDRSHPVLFTRIEDRQPRKGPAVYLRKIEAASAV